MASILLVEDDDMIGRMIGLRLRIAGHEVALARDGREGIDRALAERFDLVLMDMHMPVVDGHEAVRELRSRGYDGQIAAVTASAMSRDSEAAIEAGCDHFISKPIGDDFENRIAEILTSRADVAVGE